MARQRHTVEQTDESLVAADCKPLIQRTLCARLATAWDHGYIGPMDLPTNRSLTDDELANAIALAITDDRQNPGQDLPFQANVNVMLARLGRNPSAKDSADFRTANAGPPQIDARIHELCWRWTLGAFSGQRQSSSE